MWAFNGINGFKKMVKSSDIEIVFKYWGLFKIYLVISW